MTPGILSGRGRGRDQFGRGDIRLPRARPVRQMAWGPWPQFRLLWPPQTNVIRIAGTKGRLCSSGMFFPSKEN